MDALNLKNDNDTYREGNLKLLEMMISQINDIIENTRHGDGPKSVIIDEDAINKKLCSTNKLAYLLETGADIDQIPNDDEIYSTNFFESIINYLGIKYKYKFYNIYTIMEMRGDLQNIYDDYNKHGYLPWDNKKEEEQMELTTKKTMAVFDMDRFIIGNAYEITQYVNGEEFSKNHCILTEKTDTSLVFSYFNQSENKMQQVTVLFIATNLYEIKPLKVIS